MWCAELKNTGYFLQDRKMTLYAESWKSLRLLVTAKTTYVLYLREKHRAIFFNIKNETARAIIKMIAIFVECQK
jgi:hypothetical protein